MPKQPPLTLCVDLDGTLVKTNTLFEAFLVAMKKNPLRIAMLLIASLKGKAHVKHLLGKYFTQEPHIWVYNSEFVTFLRAEHAKGRKLILATASDYAIAERVAKEFGMFEEIIANTIAEPVNAASKYRILQQRFGGTEFAYAGNSRSDISVWNIATSAIVVNASKKVSSFARQHFTVEAEFPNKNQLRWKHILQEIRVHQWLKNLLLFIPLIMAHRIGDSEAVLAAVVGFFSFSFLASSMYTMNDLLDIPSDRAHHTKRLRPIALGTISALQGMILAVLLMIGSFTLALTLLPSAFSWILLSYFAINILYSFKLKKLPYVDIVILAALYVLRIIAGSAATDVPTSTWLFFFAGCFFFYLASMKRVVELLQLAEQQNIAPGRGYRKRDTPILIILGIAFSLFSCIILGLYIVNDSVTYLYARPEMLWILLPLLSIWIVRMWHITLAKNMPDDPVLFTSKDPLSYGIGIAIASVLLFAAL